MLLFLAPFALAAEPPPLDTLPVEALQPALEVDWRGGRGTLHATPPEGLALSQDAPVRLELDGARPRHATGARLARGLPVRAPDRVLQGTLALSVCREQGAACREIEVAFVGEVPDRRATLALDVSPIAPPFRGEDWRAEQAELVRAALAPADDLALVVFSAAWCPPCNQLAAEVLDASDAGETLAGLHLVRVDADALGAWALKDHFAVGGYPTSLVVRPGEPPEVLGRISGYPSRERFLAWLGDSREGGLAARLAAGPEQATPDQAAEVAWALVERGESPKSWLPRAEGAHDPLPATMARFRTTGGARDGAWLLEHAPERVADWGPGAVAHPTPPELDAEIREAVLAHEGPADVRAWLLHELADDRAAGAREGAALLSSALTGDPSRDRHLYTLLGRLHAEGGALDEGVKLLDRAAADFPGEPTFPLAAARHLLRAGHLDDALARADLAFERSWDDNRLVAATVRAEVLMQLGREDEARDFAREVLQAIPAPPEGAEVRAFRYRAGLGFVVGLE